jgi:class 3 adenylate cyclase
LLSTTAAATVQVLLPARQAQSRLLREAGDLIGSGASQEQAIVGETPNLAARLQGVAEPNSVVIAESTRKLAVAVPATLHASLMARLDRLGPAKEIAQIGAVIGRYPT